MSDTKNKIIDAALTCAQQSDWNFVTLQDIIEQAGTSLVEFYNIFEDKDDILRAYGRRVDLRVIEAFDGSQELEGDSPKDALFDILMERFDVLNENRDAVLSIMRCYKYDPKRAAIALPYVAKSMSKMLELTGQSCEGWRGCIKVLGLTTLYLDIALRTWSKDESRDMPKTMAALDKALGRAEQVANSFML